MTRLRGCMHRSRVEVCRDKLLLNERGLLGSLQLRVASIRFVRDLDQLGQQGLAPALVAIPQLFRRLSGPAW